MLEMTGKYNWIDKKNDYSFILNDKIQNQPLKTPKKNLKNSAKNFYTGKNEGTNCEKFPTKLPKLFRHLALNQ